jgi:hypothetical protein
VQDYTKGFYKSLVCASHDGNENQIVYRHVIGFNFAMRDEIILHKICFIEESNHLVLKEKGKLV